MQTAFTEDMRGKTLEERKEIFKQREQQILKEVKEGHEDDLYKDVCQTRHAKSFIPILIGLVLLIVLFIAEHYMSAIFCFMASLLITAICSTVASSKNASDAKYYDLTAASARRVQQEKVNASVGAASVVAGSIVTGKHVKDAVNEIRNPDSWKEMK